MSSSRSIWAKFYFLVLIVYESLEHHIIKRPQNKYSGSWKQIMSKGTEATEENFWKTADLVVLDKDETSF